MLNVVEMSRAIPVAPQSINPFGSKKPLKLNVTDSMPNAQ